MYASTDTHAHTCCGCWLVWAFMLVVQAKPGCALTSVRHSSNCKRLCCDGEPALNRPAQARAMAQFSKTTLSASDKAGAPEAKASPQYLGDL